jgi:hypothetical protein
MTTRNNSLLNNASNNRLNDLITMKLSMSKEDSYDLGPQKINFQNFIKIKDKMVRRGGCSSENISVRKDNDSQKFNRTVNSKLPPSIQINSNWEMLMKSPEFASILDQIKAPDQKAVGIDLQNPLNYGNLTNSLFQELNLKKLSQNKNTKKVVFRNSKARTRRDRVGLPLPNTTHLPRTSNQSPRILGEPMRTRMFRLTLSILILQRVVKVRRPWRISRRGE